MQPRAAVLGTKSETLAVRQQNEITTLRGRSKEELRIASDMLRAFRTSRSQRARLDYAAAVPVKPVGGQAETPEIPKHDLFRKFREFSESFRPLALIAAIALGIVTLLAGGNYLADHLINGLRAEAQRENDQWWQEEFARRAQQAQISQMAAGWIQLPDGQFVFPHYLGKVPDSSHLPLTGNHLWDAYQSPLGSTTWVWAIARGTQTPQWVDP